MKVRQLLDSTRLEKALKRAVAKEDLYIPRSSRNPSNSCIQGIPSFYPVEHRRDTLLWLRHLTYSVFHFSPDTFALALNVFDRFLCAVKVQAKHIRCIGAASLLIAGKISQEPENEPSAKEIVDLGGCTFSRGDVTRMERIILSKLSWDVDAATPLGLLNILHALTCSWSYLAPCCAQPMMHLRKVTDVLESCLLDIQFASWKPSVLALAVLSNELRKMEGCDWLDATMDLQSSAMVSGRDLSVCFEKVQSYCSKICALPKAIRVQRVISARRQLFGSPDDGGCSGLSPLREDDEAADSSVVSSDDDSTSEDSDPDSSQDDLSLVASSDSDSSLLTSDGTLCPQHARPPSDSEFSITAACALLSTCKVGPQSCSFALGTSMSSSAILTASPVKVA